MSSSHSSPPSPKLRFGTTKSKGGCLTCKQRRVKCDEGKPKCQKCRRGHRECAGYPELSASPPQAVGFVHYVVNISRTLDQLPDLGLRERRSLRVFQEKMAPEVGGIFVSGLWSRYTLLVAVHEPAIRHAIVALSTVHEQFFNSLHEPHTRISEFALTHYGRALSEIIRLQDTSSPHAVEVALLGSLLFSSMEVLQGHYVAAMTHIRYGTHLLVLDQGGTATPEVIVPKLAFRQTFTRITSQGLEMGTLTIADYPTSINKCPRRAPFGFNSLAEASHSMSALWNRMLVSMHDPGLCVIQSDSSDEQRQTTEMRRKTIITNYEAWVKSFDALPFTADMQTSDIAVLETYRTLIKILLCVELLLGQASFDKYDHEFQDIVLLCSIFIDDVTKLIHQPTSNVREVDVTFHHHSNTRSDEFQDARTGNTLNIQPRATPFCAPEDWPQLPPPRLQRPTVPILPKPGAKWKPTFSSGLGIITPLFLTAVRCRNYSIRRQALYLLSICNRKEGIWDSLITAKVVERVIELESGGLKHTDKSTAGSVIPEHARVEQVQVNYRSQGAVVHLAMSSLCTCEECEVEKGKELARDLEDMYGWSGATQEES